MQHAGQHRAVAQGAVLTNIGRRSLHDALCVVRCLVHRKFLIPGGAAPEVELSMQLAKWAKTLQVRLRWLCQWVQIQVQWAGAGDLHTMCCMLHCRCKCASMLRSAGKLCQLVMSVHPCLSLLHTRARTHARTLAHTPD